MKDLTTNIDTSTPEGFKEGREALGLTQNELARILRTNDRTLKRWETRNAGQPPHPTAAALVSKMLNGFRPYSWPLNWTGPQLEKERLSLGMTHDQLAVALDVETETLLKYERGDGPPEVVAEAILWLKEEKE